MKISRLLLAVTCFVFLFIFAVSTATAGSMGNGAAQRQKLVIDSIDAASGTVVFKSMIDQTAHTYKIASTTHITVGNAKGAIDQIKVGQKVVNYAPMGSPAAGETPTLTMLLVWPTAPASANK